MEGEECESVLLDLQAATLALEKQEESRNEREDTGQDVRQEEPETAAGQENAVEQSAEGETTARTTAQQMEKAAEWQNALEEATVLPLDGCYGSTPLDLGEVTMGKPKRECLIVRNQTSKEQQVTVDRFPFSKGFSLAVIAGSGEEAAFDGSAPIQFMLEARSQAVFFVGFTAPTIKEAHSYRHVANFYTGKRSYKLSLQVLAKPPAKRKPRRQPSKRTGFARKGSTRAPLKSVNGSNPSRLRQAVSAKPVSGPGTDSKDNNREGAKHDDAAASTDDQGAKTTPATSTGGDVRPKALKMPVRKRASQLSNAVTAGPGSEREAQKQKQPHVSHPSRHDRQERAFTMWLNHVLVPEQSAVNMHTKRERMKLRSRAHALLETEAIANGLSTLKESIQSGGLVAREESCIFLDIHLRDEVLRVFMSFHPEWLRLGLETLFDTAIPITDPANPTSSLKSFVVSRVMDDEDIKTQYSYPAVPSHLLQAFHSDMANHILYNMIGLIFFLDHARMRGFMPQSSCLFMPATFQSSSEILAFISNKFLKGEGSLEKHLRYLGLFFSYTQTALDEYDFEVTNLSTDLRNGVRLWRVLATMQRGAAAPYKPAVIDSTAVWTKNNQQYLAALKAAGCKQFFPQRAAEDLAKGHRDVTLAVLWATLVCFRICNPVDEALLQAEIARVKRHASYRCLDDRRASEAHMYQNSAQVNLLLQWCRAVCACFDLEVSDFTSSFSDGRALCYLISFYHPQLLPPACINATTTTTLTNDRTFDSRMAAVQESEQGFSCVMSPGINKVGGRSRQQLLENEKQNFKLISVALKKLGGVPMLAKSKDMIATVPDERVVISYVSCLCARLLDINQEQRACLVIQRHWRRYKQRASLEAATITIQQRWRAVLHMRRHQSQYRRVLAAAVKLQSGVRMYQQRRRFNRTARAIVCLQACTRRWLAVRERAHLKGQRDAAVVLQSAVRAMVARRRYAVLHKERARHRAAVCIQRHVRAYVARAHFQRQLAAAITIQAAFRAKQGCREAVARLRAVRLLQTRLRATLLARRTREAFTMQRIATVVLQRAWRQRCMRKQTQAACLARRQAATRIQSAWRMLRCRRERTRRLAALIVLQSGVRMWRAKQHLQKLGQEWAAATTLQRVARGMLARTALRRTLDRLSETRAAISIQRHVRGWLCRRSFKSVKGATIAMQAAVRGQQGRRLAATRLQAVRVIQVHARALLQGQQVREEYAAMKHAALILQRQWRLRTEAKHTRALCGLRRRASITIQQNWRMWRCRTVFLRYRAATITLQTYTRGMLARKQAAHLGRRRDITSKFARALQYNLCAVTIQRAFRAFLARKRAVTALQTRVRGWLTHRRYTRMRAAAITLQRHARGLLVRRAFAALRQQRVQRFTAAARVFLATVCLQRAFRRSRAQKRAATMLQAHVRAWLARTRYRQMQKAVVQLQCAWRCMRAARELERRRKHAEHRARVLALGARMFFSAVRIQRGVRAFVQRRREERAARVIQRHFREWRQVHSRACKEAAATRIQAWFRAYRIRKRMSARLRQIHQNVVEVNKAYCPEATLGWKTNSALTVLLKYKKVKRVLEALKNLNRMAGLSAECCARIASHDGLDVIYTLIRSCNRSLPEMAMVVHCLSIIESLLRYDDTCDHVLQNLQLGQLMFDLTRGYRDNADIFEPACRLLHRCCQQPAHRARLQKDRSLMKRLASLINLTERKAKVYAKTKDTSKRVEAASLSELVSLLQEIQQVLAPDTTTTTT